MFCKNCGNELKNDIKFCTNCGNTISVIKKEGLKSLLTRRRVFLIVSILIVLSLIVFFYFSFKNPNISTDKRNQDIASTVVNIYCMGETEEEDSGGSGTILTEDGLVLTNAHIIPTGSDGTVSCLVVLPEPITGAPDEIYYGYPIIVPELSEQYDLAFIQIDDVYIDEDGVVYGDYPKTFPAYNSDKYCKNEKIKLGEPVKVYGYPAISGGYALTVTDGIVSSFLIDEGLIVTSAKISPGNSGGLAVDGNGCSIGIPSMYMSDEAESLGFIISNDLIYDFIDELISYMDLNNL